MTAQLGAKAVALLVGGDLDRTQLVEIADHVRLGDIAAALVEAAVQVDLMPQRQRQPTM